MGGKYSDPKPLMSITYSLVTPVQSLDFIISLTITIIIATTYYFVIFMVYIFLFFVDPMLDCFNGLFPRGCSSKIKISYCRRSNGFLFTLRISNAILMKILDPI